MSQYVDVVAANDVARTGQLALMESHPLHPVNSHGRHVVSVRVGGGPKTVGLTPEVYARLADGRLHLVTAPSAEAESLAIAPDDAEDAEAVGVPATDEEAIPNEPVDAPASDEEPVAGEPVEAPASDEEPIADEPILTDGEAAEFIADLVDVPVNELVAGGDTEAKRRKRNRR